MFVNITFCSAGFTADKLPLIGASAIGDPALPLVRAGAAAGAAGHGRLLFRYLGETGCRFGVNDAGVFIGCVENYSKLKSPSGCRTGMEAAEEALARCETSLEAQEKLISLIGGGLSASDSGLQCAFYISGPGGDRILETANELWAATAAPDYNAICGDFFIAANYDEASPAAASHPKAKKGKLDFNAAFSAAGRSGSAGVSIRRFLAVQTIYELINGEPSQGFLNLILGRNEKRAAPAGLDAASMRLVIGARSKQVRSPIENMSVTPQETGKFITSGAAVYSGQSRIIFYTPGPVPSVSLYVPCALPQALLADEQDSAREWVSWEFVRRSAESGALDPEVLESALRAAQRELDSVYSLMLSGDGEPSGLSGRAADIAGDCLASLMKKCSLPLAKLSPRGLRYRTESASQLAALAKLAEELGLSV